MGESNDEQRPRASLRGRGREIFFGKRAAPAEEPAPPPPLPEQQGRVDPAALKLTPEESAALLNFSPDAPVYAAEVSLPAGPSSRAKTAPSETPAVIPDPSVLAWMQQESSGEEPSAPVVPAELPREAIDEVLEVNRSAEQTWNEVEFTFPDEDEYALPPVMEIETPVLDAIPLAEREPEPPPATDEDLYQPQAEVEALIPRQPETWPGIDSVGMHETPPAARPVSVGPTEAIFDETGGVTYQTSDEEAAYTLPDPFGIDAKPSKRPSARVLFGKTPRADKDLLNLLVDDDRILKLSQQIEAMQDDLAQNVVGDRKTTDAYQKELLQASSLLLASRANYDDARAVVYRVRSDINRQRKVVADIRRYRPLLLNYYIGWGITLIVLFLLKSLFTGVTDAVGVGIASALYYPMLLGIGGSLIAGYLTLERHTTRQRDFDPLHISWYLFNPLMGSVMGLLMFLLASIANEDLLRETASGAENAIAYLLCVVGGMNQNNVLRQ
ncbi:MAG: hypothetical protein HY866_07900, partial [Chloroflexi bacterium]|nr:hypothetical protein [Chloroflexota bacterium]